MALSVAYLIRHVARRHRAPAGRRAPAHSRAAGTWWRSTGRVSRCRRSSGSPATSAGSSSARSWRRGCRRPRRGRRRSTRPSRLRRHVAPLGGQRLGRPGAEPVVARAVERDHGARERAARAASTPARRARRAPPRPQPLQRHRARGRPPDRLGVLAQRLRVEVAGRDARPRRCRRRAHSRASARVKPSTAARAALECVIPASPWCGDSVTFTTVPPPAGRNASSAARAPSAGPADVEPVTARQPFGSIASAGTKY